METKRSQKFLQRRRLLIMLPVLTVPFACALFWLLSQDSNAMTQNDDIKKGLNTELPDAQLKDKASDKLSFYKQADNDSVTLQEQIRNDPYYSFPDTSLLGGYSTGATPTGLQVYNDPNVSRINERLSMLTQQMNEPSYEWASTYRNETGGGSNDLRKLDAMVQSIGQGGGQDPEMMQLNAMLEKLLDLQNPGRANERIREQSLKNKKQVYPVSAIKKDRSMDVFSSSQGMQSNGFYEWNENLSADTFAANAVEAVVAETRVLTAGSSIKLKLLDDIIVAGKTIPAGSFVFGYCTVNDDRLSVSINSVRHNKSLLTVSLDIYDNDGIRGIYVPGAITRDVAKNAASEAVQGFDMYTMSNSVGVQAATAGVNAAKTLVSKKTKLVKVTVKSGYRIFLKNTNEQD